MGLRVKRLFCLGYGYTARRFAARLKAEGWAIAATARDDEKAGALAAEKVEPIDWREDGLGPHSFDTTSAALVSTPPDAAGCPAFRVSEPSVRYYAKTISWIGYLSSNGVYGDYGGAWVDENSSLRATSQRASNRIAAENQWRALGAAANVPVVIFRLPGIYGPGRSALDAVREGRAQRIVKEGQVFSRAHVDDIAAALAASIDSPAAGTLFNIADDEPAPPQDVVAYACALLKVAPPPLIPFAEAKLSDMAKSFYADNKRVSNALMKARLLPALKYPTYREGLAAILAEERASARIQG
jgi:nucleoside-diphosphate-sugar epimerase